MTYTTAAFMGDAKRLLDEGGYTNEVKMEIAARLSDLAKRDDLTRFAAQLGPTDASNHTYLLWREPPFFTLLMVRFDEHFLSPVHDHAEHWIAACCYRGADRWDLYERTDGNSGPGEFELDLVDQVLLKPGDSIVLAPPRSVHSHNNVAPGDTLELIFSAAPPTPAKSRMMFDLATGVCVPSWYEISDQLSGEFFPPRLAD
jgi:predicted metal-dependent enzyme (double-stranded beta helix superfamily)